MLYVTAKRIGKNWLKFQPIYRFFCYNDECYDFSDKAAYEAFLYESQGKGNHKFGSCQRTKKWNGYIVGKHWMDVNVKMWREDIQKGLLKKYELYSDPEMKNFHWWLDKVLKGV